jgi:hypothetical protein
MKSVALGNLLQHRSGPLRLSHNLRLLPGRPLAPPADRGLMYTLCACRRLLPVHLRLTCTPLRCVSYDRRILPLARTPTPWATPARLPYTGNKKTYNNAISALRRAFDFGYLDYPERRDPAASLKCARIGKNDRPPIDPFSIQDAEVLSAAIHQDRGEAQGNYAELRFFTGLRPSEEIALVVTDYDAAHGVLSITKARVLGIDKDVTKTGEDRRIRLCRRAITVIERQLRLRERLAREGR